MQHSEETKWIDVSATISNGMVHWPDNVPVSVTRSSVIGINNSPANVSAITMSVHTGTHMDAQRHFYANGFDITKMDINALIGPAKVFHVRDEKNQITYNIIKELSIEKGDRILFRTRNSDSDWETEPFKEDYVRLAPDAAKYLVEKGVSCVGIDYLSVAGGKEGEEVHRILLGVPVHVIEGLKLGNISQGYYDMICLPIKLKDTDGAPSRVILKARPDNQLKASA